MEHLVDLQRRIPILLPSQLLSCTHRPIGKLALLEIKALTPPPIELTNIIFCLKLIMLSSIYTLPPSGASVAGASVAGASVAGASVAGASVAGASVAGSSVAGASVAGASVAGASVAGSSPEKE